MLALAPRISVVDWRHYTGAPEAVRHWSGKYTEAAKQPSNLPREARKIDISYLGKRSHGI